MLSAPRPSSSEPASEASSTSRCRTNARCAMREACGVAWPRLEPLERRVLELIVDGLSNRQVAEELGVPIEEVRASLDAVFARLGASSTIEALIIAIRHGLIRRPPV